jgi:myosin heavy subunit
MMVAFWDRTHSIFLNKGGDNMLEYQVDSIEGMDESIASFYQQDGDKYVLSVNGIPTSSQDSSREPVELKNTLTKVRSENRELEKQLKQYRGIDSKLEQYKQMEEELTQIRQAEQLRKEKEAEEIARKTGEWESQKKSLLQSHEKSIKEMNEKYESLLREKTDRLNHVSSIVNSTLLDAEVTKAVLSVEGNLDILKPHVVSNLKVIEEDGNLAVRVVDSDGNVRINDTGDPLRVTDLLEEFKAMPSFQGDGIFKKPKKSGGSNSSGNTSSTPSVKNPFNKENPNYTEQALLYKRDPVMADRLKAEAGIE